MTSNTGLMQIVRNIAWHSSEKVLRMLLGFLVGLWLARYLGPEQFGRFNYVIAWLCMFTVISWLGVGETAMRDMVRDRDDEGRILGSALLIRLCGSLLAVMLALGAAKWLGGFDATQLTLLAILCIGVPFAEVPAGIWLWFASHINIGPAVLGKNTAMIVGAALKIAVIVSGAGLIALMGVMAIESVVYGLCLIVAYLWYGERFSQWRFDFNHAWNMLRTGLPIILSMLVVSLNARVDQIILGHLTGMSAVGVYAAAMRFSEIWWVVPPMLMQTLAARYIYPEDLGERLKTNVARITAGMALLSLLPCFLISIIGSEVINAILGKQYLGAGSVLLIHIWIAVLVFIDAPVCQYLLATHRQALLVIKSTVLLIMNFALALILVPHYGPQGAALATLLAETTTVFMLPLLYPPLRDLCGIYGLAIKEIPALFALLSDFLPQPRTIKNRIAALNFNSVSVAIALFCCFFAWSAWANKTDLASLEIAARHYLFLWLLTLLFAAVIQRSVSTQRFCKLMLAALVVQVSGLILQQCYLAKGNGADWNTLVGSVSKSFLAGGFSGSALILPVFGIILAVSLFKYKRIGFKMLVLVVLAASATVAPTELNVISIVLLLGLVLLFYKNILISPLKFVGGSLFVAMLLGSALLAHRQLYSERHNEPISLEGFIDYAAVLVTKPYFLSSGISELPPLNANPIRQRSGINDYRFYIGHGPAANHGTAGTDQPASFTPGASTASTMLWDLGLLGYALFLGMLSACAITALRLARHVPPMEAAALDSIGVMLLLNLPLSVYNHDLIDSPVTQILLAFCMGYTLSCKKKFSVSVNAVNKCQDERESYSFTGI
ncbi:MAG: flippase [Methylobacter sp.]|nr:flippase [Methylobacter sp.]